MAILLKFIKFSVVGFSGLLIDFGLTYLLKEKLKVQKYLANAIGFIVAAVSNYFFNRIWTFESANQNIEMEFTSFFVISMIGLGINTFFLWLCVKKFKLNFYLSKLIAIIITTGWNFVANLLITFSGHYF